MTTKNLKNVRVAVVAADGFEEVELTVPVKALKKAGARVHIVSLHPSAIRGMNHMIPGKKVGVDRTILEVDPDEYDALLLPGGLISPDALRQSDEVLEFVRSFDRARKPIAVICHGPWLLISAGLASGRQLTSWPGIQDDVRNAGASWTDAKLVKDGNWISSRSPADLPVFVDAMLERFGSVAPAPKEKVPASAGRKAAWGSLGAVAAVAAGVAAWKKWGGEERE
jgi:protease I